MALLDPPSSILDLAVNYQSAPVSTTSCTARIIDSAVNFPVLGFSLGIFSICTCILAELAFDIDVVAVARQAGHGKDAHTGLVRADPRQAYRAGNVNVCRKAAAGFARRAGENFLLFLQANQGDAALDQIGRPFEAQRRFARRVRDMGDSADSGRLDAIQAGDGARRDVQVATGAGATPPSPRDVRAARRR